MTKGPGIRVFDLQTHIV